MVLKPSENPPITWPEEESIEDFAGTWRVAHTKSRNEKALAWQMVRKQICYFLPMHEKVSRKNGRTNRSILPLFTGYIFFCGSEDHRLKALQTNRVANIIEVKDQDRLISDLSAIENVLQKGAPLQPHKYIEAGQRCRVIAGPLAGTEGVVEINQPNHLILQVDMLGRATSVQIDTDMIEIIE